MDQDRWREINDIFHTALELSSTERKHFVFAASKGDAELLAEVELLLQADQDAGNYLESPLIPSYPFSPTQPPLDAGDVLCGRFRILRAVAEGGMGHVFEAFDSELAVHVALKVLRTEIASNPEALARFRQEVRLARQITHPNVCRTYDIEREIRPIDPPNDRYQEIVFLTMEFLSGETLASRIKRAGPLPLEEALCVARQIADALEAASRLDIIHRDIKPGNIMLVPAADDPHRFRAVVTDFGLARIRPEVSRRVSAFSQTGRLIGTLAYMAPEQLEGIHLSSATDIYAFGLVLFEMVTGERAFPSDNLLSGIAQRLTGPPPSPSALVPNLPLSWCQAIEGCLQPRPADRFQKATAALAVLDGSQLASQSLRSVPNKTTLRFRSPWFRRSEILLIFLLALALFWFGLRFYTVKKDTQVAPGALIYITPVKNETGDTELDNLSDLVQSSLAQSVRINLLDESRVGETLQLMTKSPDTVISQPIAREIALRNGVVRVVFPTVSGTSGSYRLNIEIQEPDSTPERYRNRWAESFEWTTSGVRDTTSIPSELFDAVRRASDWIRHEAGESANDIARLDAPPGEVTTSNWQALADYTEADRLTRDNQMGNAVVLLKNAIAQDPQFALAQARLGDLLVSLHRDMEGYQAYDAALDLARHDRLTRKEEDRIRGMRAVDTADYAVAVDAYRDYTVYYKNDYFGWAYPTFPLRMLRRDEEAISNLQRAIALSPERAFAPFALAQELLIVGRSSEAQQWSTHLRKYGHTELAEEVDALLFLEHRNFDDAARIVQRFNESDDPMRRSFSYQMQASIAAETGYQEKALDFLNRGLREDEAQNNFAERAAKLLGRAYLECKAKDFGHALDDTQLALKLNLTPNTILSSDTILGIASAEATPSIATQAREQLADIQRSLPHEEYGAIFTVAKLRTRGEILLANGKTQEALELFEDAAAKDAPASNQEYLGRAYASLARQMQSVPERQKLYAKAMAAYANIALRPLFVWCEANSYPPGVVADQLTAYLTLATKAGATNSEVIAARNLLGSFHRPTDARKSLANL